MKSLFFSSRSTSCWIPTQSNCNYYKNHLMWLHVQPHMLLQCHSALIKSNLKQAKTENQNFFLCKKQSSLQRRRNGGTERERAQESIRRCQRGWACPQPCKDWNNECVLGEHLPLMLNVANAFWNQRAQMTKFSKKTVAHENRYCCTVVLCLVPVCCPQYIACIIVSD